ncbi:MAG: DDE-type integrase/transposase/recombinase [Gemmatimonadaceae bacterium]|nr:DDE-type integrase/transposase/recombinase [Gemmatimonadaceae bacterium]
MGHCICGDFTRRARRVGKQVHPGIDDQARLAYAEVLEDDTAATAADFLARAVARYAALDGVVERIHTDKGSRFHALPIAAHPRAPARPLPLQHRVPPRRARRSDPSAAPRLAR